MEPNQFSAKKCIKKSDSTEVLLSDFPPNSADLYSNHLASDT